MLVLFYNTLAYTRTEIVSLVVPFANVVVTDDNNKTVPTQVGHHNIASCNQPPNLTRTSRRIWNSNIHFVSSPVFFPPRLGLSLPDHPPTCPQTNSKAFHTHTHTLSLTHTERLSFEHVQRLINPHCLCLFLALTLLLFPWLSYAVSLFICFQAWVPFSLPRKSSCGLLQINQLSGSDGYTLWIQVKTPATGFQCYRISPGAAPSHEVSKHMVLFNASATANCDPY